MCEMNMGLNVLFFIFNIFPKMGQYFSESLLMFLKNRPYSLYRRYNIDYGPPGTYQLVFSHNLYIIRLLKTTHPIEFLNISNWTQL